MNTMMTLYTLMTTFHMILKICILGKRFTTRTTNELSKTMVNSVDVPLKVTLKGEKFVAIIALVTLSQNFRCFIMWLTIIISGVTFKRRAAHICRRCM